jgi:hypothetical protein
VTSPGRFDELADRLDTVVEDLDELSLELLQAAVAAGATQRPTVDKTVTQARRAVEKAAHLLRSLAEPDH